MSAHLACATVDLTMIGGINCHGAAIIYQVSASDTCNAEAEDCRDAQSVH
jgi:hypothetical protein